MHGPNFPSICWWTLGLSLPFGNCWIVLLWTFTSRFLLEHLLSVFFSMCTPRSGILSHRDSKCNLLRNGQTVFPAVLPFSFFFFLPFSFLCWAVFHQSSHKICEVQIQLLLHTPFAYEDRNWEGFQPKVMQPVSWWFSGQCLWWWLKQCLCSQALYPQDEGLWPCWSQAIPGAWYSRGDEESDPGGLIRNLQGGVCS